MTTQSTPITQSTSNTQSAPSLAMDTAATVASTERDIEHGLPPGFGKGRAGTVLYWIAILFAVFQLTMSIYAILPAEVIRAIHVGFLCLLASALVANHSEGNGALRVGGWLMGLAAMGVALYQWGFHTEILLRSGDRSNLDIGMGILALAVLFILVFRLMGPALPIISGLFLAYGLFGQYLPSGMNHRGYGLDQIIDQLSYGTEGIYGTPTGVSSTYIFLFILFGAFLERAGMIGLFTDIAMGLFGAARGGPAKVSVFSSALMGTISGSGVANVVSTGQFTIPLMKRFGYRAAFAGGVEATASMGGQIMPPVMGAVAFIMAETLDVPYAEVVKAAIIPALLYFGAAFWSVHLEAGRYGLVGLPRDGLPSARKAITERWYLLTPLVILIYLLFSGYTPLFAGTIGLALTAVVILGGAIVAGVGSFGLRVLFWLFLGLVSASFLQYGTGVLLVVVAALVLACFFVKGGRETLLICRDSLADGARQALPVGLACAVVGIVIGILTLTGVATIIGNAVIGIGKDNLFLALLLTMGFSLVLGMGIPTIPNYIITSSLAAPILVKLGVPLIVSHMFVFYFGIMADLTPPVALAAFAAAPIARESGFKIGGQALKIAAAGFIVPYMAVYTPALMLQPGGEMASSMGFWPAVAYVVFKASLAVALWGITAIGYLRAPATLFERLLAFVAAAMLVVAAPFTDEIGYALAALFFGLHWLRTRGQGVAP